MNELFHVIEGNEMRTMRKITWFEKLKCFLGFHNGLHWNVDLGEWITQCRFCEKVLDKWEE